MDPITRVQVTDSIRKAREEFNQTFLIISHDMDFVLEVCDRAALMRGGKIPKDWRATKYSRGLNTERKK